MCWLSRQKNFPSYPRPVPRISNVSSRIPTYPAVSRYFTVCMSHIHGLQGVLQLLHRLQNIVFRFFLSEAYDLDGGDGADTVDAVEHLLSDLINENPSQIRCFLYFSIFFRGFHVVKMDNLPGKFRLPRAPERYAASIDSRISPVEPSTFTMTITENPSSSSVFASKVTW